MKPYIRYALLVLTILPSWSQSRPAVSSEMFDQWFKELSNWGRWGKDDELGAVNLITAATRKRAVSLVKEGASFSLSPRRGEGKGPR